MSNLYIQSLEVVGGILTPIMIILLIRLGTELAQENHARYDYMRQAAEKSPPFDDEASFYEVPNDSMIGVRLKKKGVVVWEGAIKKIGTEL